MSQFMDGLAGHPNRARYGLQLAAYETQQRRLAATAAAHDGNHLPLDNAHVHFLEDRTIVVGKIDVVYFDQMLRRHDNEWYSGPES